MRALLLAGAWLTGAWLTPGAALSAQAVPDAQAAVIQAAPDTLTAPEASGVPAGDGRPEPIRAVLIDRDGDRVPDRVGETVTVTGRATVADDALGLMRTTSLSDGNRALWLRSIPDLRVAAGDSLVASGVLSFWNGLAVIDGPAVQRIPAEPWVPSPTALSSGDLEEWEGQLVTVEGVVAGVNRVQSGGQAMMLALDDRSLVTAFVFDSRPTPLDLGGYTAGDRLRVTGLAGQFDRVAPYDATYQIYPRGPGDLDRGGIPLAAYGWAAAIASLLLVAAGFWVLALRAEVRRRAASVRQSNAHYRAIVSSASDAVFVHRLDGTGIEVNPAARQAFGLAPEAPAPSLLEVVGPEHVDRASAHLILVQAHGNARCDLGVRPLAGAEPLAGSEPQPSRPYEFESQLIEVAGERRVLSLARDVGARRAYEAELLRARSEAEEMARLKSAFLASMSHEIRTPLTAVIGYAEILADEVDPEQRELAEIIGRGGRRLLQTLNSVLDLARLDAGAEVLAPRPLDLAEHLRHSVELVRSLAEAKGLALRFQHDGCSLPAAVDPGALDRIVTNLVGNAIKFTESGGVSVWLSADGPDAVLSVRDTGPGIDASFLPELFSEFRQESEGDARRHEGSGLGLAITRRLVEMMGGEISVESEKGVGSTFTVRIPRVPESMATGAFPPEAAMAELAEA